VTDILLATDADWVHDEVEAAVAGSHTLHRVRSGAAVLPTIREVDPDVVILDLQIGNMGGVATCLAIRHEEGDDRLAERPVLLLLDREVDVYLAQQADADGWLVKPLDAFRLLRAIEKTLAGEAVTEAVPQA
jgi:DNA-binding NarL/FixJ family response regulator